jgi:hypothetical protein
MNAENTFILFVIIVRSLRDAYEMNACIAGCVCLPDCPHVSTEESLDGSG